MPVTSVCYIYKGHLPLNMQVLRKNTGQFVPITAMVTFTMVIFLVATVNVYKVTRAKLKIQNIADAAALNLASQQAQALNLVTDRNEWLNNMTQGIPSPSDPEADQKLAASVGSLEYGKVSDCSFFNAQNEKMIPGISCAENPYEADPKNKMVYTRHIFNSLDGAKTYAALIQTINSAQRLFVQAYNSFLGADSAVGSSSSFQQLLEQDIPELKSDPTIHLIARNQGSADDAESVLSKVKDMPGQLDSQNMRPLRFKAENIEVRFWQDKKLGFITHKRADIGGSNLSSLMDVSPDDPDQNVGWLKPDFGPDRMPRIQMGGENGGEKMGVDVYVTKEVDLGPILGKKTVIARSKAYVVETSGQIGEPRNGIPIFTPTYWVKLGK